MKRSVTLYEKKIKKALSLASRYSPSLDIQISNLAADLLVRDMAMDEIANLDSCVVSEIGRAGQETLRQHPVFKIQRDYSELVTKQMKALGLTAADLSGMDSNDPMIDLTKQLLSVAPKKKTIKPKPRKE